MSWALNQPGVDPLTARVLSVETRGTVLILRAGGTFAAAVHADGTLEGRVSSNDVIVGNDLRDLVCRLLAAGVALPKIMDSRIAGLVIGGGTAASVDGYYSLEAMASRRDCSPDAPFAHDLYRRATATERDSAIVDLEHRALIATAAMCNAGMPIDRDAWGVLVNRRRELADEAFAFVRNEFGVDISSNRKLLAALRDKGFDVEGTGAKHLYRVRGHELIEVLIQWRRASAFVNDLGPAVLAASQQDGRVHADIEAWGTETGRFTASNPNVLGLEKAADVRRCVVAPDGHVLISIDVSAADLRSLAAITEDQALLDMFGAKQCPHTATAAALFDCLPAKVTPEQREVAKVVNFTTVFGGGPEAAVSQARNRGLNLTPEAAAIFMSRFGERFEKVAAWQDAVRSDSSETVRSLLGRSRWVANLGVPARLNSPVQMTTADGAKLAAVALHEELPRFGARLLLVVHDEYVIEAPRARAREVAAHAEAVITREFGRGLLNRVPVVASVKTTGRSWGGER